MSKLFTKRMNWTTLETIIRNNDEFHNYSGTFKGVHWDADHAELPGKGKMPEAEYNTLELMHRLRGIDYVVYSYRTVIAYRTANGVWHIPDVHYSSTTTAHQNVIRVVAEQFRKVSA